MNGLEVQDMRYEALEDKVKALEKQVRTLELRFRLLDTDRSMVQVLSWGIIAVVILSAGALYWGLRL